MPHCKYDPIKSSHPLKWQWKNRMIWHLSPDESTTGPYQYRHKLFCGLQITTIQLILFFFCLHLLTFLCNQNQCIVKNIILKWQYINIYLYISLGNICISSGNVDILYISLCVGRDSILLSLFFITF